MRYYYVVFDCENFALCFNSNKDIKKYFYGSFYTHYKIYKNKKELPEYIKLIVGNNTCKDNIKQENNFIIKNSLKEKLKRE